MGDEMEVDPSFSCGEILQKLGVSELCSLAPRYRSVVEDGFDHLDFPRLVATLCNEIKVLYGLDEGVTLPSDNFDVKAFLFELSAFLSEIECASDGLTMGRLEDRFGSAGQRDRLVAYLLDEYRAARTHALNQLNTPTKVADKPLTKEIMSALNTLQIPRPPAGASIDPLDLISKLAQEADKRLQMCTVRPEPLFKGSTMDAVRWQAVESAARAMAVDCRARNVLLLKRVDVTLNSFLWSERVKKREADIMQLFTHNREKMAKITIPDTVALLSATDRLLVIEPASSAARRMAASRVQPSALAEKPKDRGGRTDEIGAVYRETFGQQNRDRGRGGGGGRGRGRGSGGGGFNSPAKNVSAEAATRQEYEDRCGGGRGGGERGRGGRGGWRGGDRGGQGGGRGGWRGNKN